MHIHKISAFKVIFPALCKLFIFPMAKRFSSELILVYILLIIIIHNKTIKLHISNESGIVNKAKLNIELCNRICSENIHMYQNARTRNKI